MKQTKMSFYVTLPSHSNRREFPNNQANSFKIRLPQPLRLQGGGWQVGLSAISLPDTGVNIFNLLPADQFVFGTSCYRLTPSAGRVVKSFNMKMDDLKDDASIVDGVTFMKAFLQWVRQRMTTAYLGYHGAPNTERGEKTCTTFEWDGEDLVMNNRNITRYKYPLPYKDNTTIVVPHLAIHHLMAEKMGWFKKNDAGNYALGPNLAMEFRDEKVPNNNDIELRNSKNDPEYYQVNTDGAGTTWIWLSFSVNWRFTNLNVAFRAVVGDPTRTLHVYSDVAGSTVVGNRVTDLLREIQYKRQGRGTLYFEPLHIQYMSLRNEVVEIIHVQVAETIGRGGDLVKFGDGHTIVTLHFKKA